MNDTSLLQKTDTGDDYIYDIKDEEVKLYIHEQVVSNGTENKNVLKSEGGVVIIPPVEEEQKFSAGEKDGEEIIYTHHTPFKPERAKPGAMKSGNNEPDFELEINKMPDSILAGKQDDSAAIAKNIEEPYEPKLDLRDYQYPSLDLLETHGSEKIIQDPAELEANKNQIINTLKNYDIAIQKISATVGSTVTLYEIVPAAGVRISRIKNLEDDIALSLAALGIRIIAPIPGKGTIGIEVPNVKKTVVSMKTLLESERFQKIIITCPLP